MLGFGIFNFIIFTVYLFAVKVDPAEAITTQNTARISYKFSFSCKNIKAHIEAAAGSKLIKILNVRGGS